MVSIKDIVHHSLQTRLYTADQEEQVNQLMSNHSSCTLDDLQSLSLLIDALAEGYIISC